MSSAARRRGDDEERRTARKGGREIVTLRRVEQDGAFVVECDVYPLNALRVEPLRPGPYRFATLDEADRFVGEAVLSLEYLGCEIT